MRSAPDTVAAKRGPSSSEGITENSIPARAGSANRSQKCKNQNYETARRLPATHVQNHANKFEELGLPLSLCGKTLIIRT